MASDDRQDQAEEAMSRLGLAAHGVYYLLLAGLVATLALRPAGGSSEASPQGALATLAEQPFGRVLLIATTIGFAAYAGHAVREALSEDEVLDRLRCAWRGLLWSALALLAARTVITASAGSGSTGRSVTARVLELPGGRFLVAAVGLVVVGVAIRFGYRAATGGLDTELQQLGLDERRVVRQVGRAGLAGRASAYGIAGGFVVIAALRSDPSSGDGLDAALQEVLRLPAGTAVAVAVAVGLAAFGGFRLLESRYRDVDDEP